MSADRIEIAPESQGPARAQYDAGASLESIARSLNMSRTTLQRCIEELGWPRRRRLARFTPAPMKFSPPANRQPAADAVTPSAPDAGPPATFTARVLDAVERELAAVERILDTLGPVEPGEAERGARTLATLARTLRELMQLRPAGAASCDGADDRPEIRDLDEFRRDLARRLDRIVADAKAACPDSAG